MCRFKRYENSTKGKFRKYKNRGKERGLKFELNFEEVDKLLTGKCYYCNKPAKPFQGIDRKDSNKGYTKSNSVGCCSECNYAKRIMTVKEFYNFIERLSISQLKKRPSFRKKIIKLLKEME